MTDIHTTIGAITIVVNAVAAVIGLIGFVRSPVRAFWYFLRAGQVLVMLSAVIGAALLLEGKDLPRLHLIYGLVPIAVSFVAEQLRLASADIVLEQKGLESAKEVATLPEAEQHALVRSIVARETLVMAASAFVVALLCLRAQGWL